MMRTKDDILNVSQKNIRWAPKDAQNMLEHEYLMLEIFIDIRDILDKVMLELYRGLRAISKQD